MKNVPLQTFFFGLCTSANIFFRNANCILLYISCLQTIYFVFLGPANNFFNIFYTPLPSPPKIQWSVHKEVFNERVVQKCSPLKDTL